MIKKYQILSKKICSIPAPASIILPLYQSSKSECGLCSVENDPVISLGKISASLGVQKSHTDKFPKKYPMKYPKKV